MLIGTMTKKVAFFDVAYFILFFIAIKIKVIFMRKLRLAPNQAMHVIYTVAA